MSRVPTMTLRRSSRADDLSLKHSAAATRSLARRLSREDPAGAAVIVGDAEQALAGLLVLPGTGGVAVHVGLPPRWTVNPTSDHEYVWGLNRMTHWTPLLRAFSLTGEAQFAEKVVAELVDWIEQNPRPPLTDTAAFDRPMPWRVLEVGIRMYDTWPKFLTHLSGTPFLTPDVLELFEQSVTEHCEALHAISPAFWPRADHNHYIMENLGLLTGSCLLPESCETRRWREHAVAQLECCAGVQLTPDGGQVEGCPHYHDHRDAEPRWFGVLSDFLVNQSTNPRIFYCPVSEFRVNTPDNPWPALTPLTPASSKTRVGYGMRPMGSPNSLLKWQDPPGGGTNAPMPSQARKLARMRSLALLSDISSSIVELRQLHRTGVNVAYADGSARWVPLSVFQKTTGHNPGPAAGISFDNPALSTFDANYNTILLDESVTPYGGIWGAWDRY